MAPSDNDLVGYEIAERITGVRRTTLASMVHRRQIPYVRLGKRIVRFSPSELRSWVDSRRVAPVAASEGSAR